MRRTSFFVIWLSLIAIAGSFGTVRESNAARDPFPVSPFVGTPTNCDQWVSQTMAHGPTVNGVSGVWLCHDQPEGGYWIEWPGQH